MRQHVPPRLVRLARLVRGLWPDRNPLRRRCDRAEGAVVAGLLFAFLAGAPVAALAAEHWVYAASLRTERVEEAAWHQVPATLLRDAPPPVYTAYGPPVQLQVPIRWAAPDGTPLTGEITAAAGTRAGSTVMVWTDVSGRLTGAPLPHTMVAGRAVRAAVLTPLGLAVCLLGAGMLVHGALDRRRLAAWDAEWSVTGPHWTSRR